VISEFFVLFKVNSMACSAQGDVLGLGQCLRKTSTKGAEFFVFAAGNHEGGNVD
jgi:hypothetical protein